MTAALASASLRAVRIPASPETKLNYATRLGRPQALRGALGCVRERALLHITNHVAVIHFVAVGVPIN
jgi:hypothetical protein